MDRRTIEMNQSGQAITEYVLLIAVITGLFVTVHQALQQSGFGARLLDPLRGEFAATYQYGHPKAKFNGQDFDGAEMHPRVTSPGNFRIFINPRK